jgi:hypothetical protein
MGITKKNFESIQNSDKATAISNNVKMTRLYTHAHNDMCVCVCGLVPGESQYWRRYLSDSGFPSLVPLQALVTSTEHNALPPTRWHTRIWEVISSNLGKNTIYSPHWGVRWLFLVSTGKVRDRTLKRSGSIPNKILHAQIILKPDALSLNQLKITVSATTGL